MSNPISLDYKIFFIGFNKTGTVSYHNMMKAVVGKRAAHRAIWTDWAFCSNKGKLDKYDVFTDGECANIRNLDVLYPNSKFILNTRTLEGWLTSRHKSIERSRLLNKWVFRKMLPIKWVLSYINSRILDNSDSAMMRWLQIRNAYHKYAIDYFKDRPQDFLVMDLAEEDTLSKLQTFLKLDIPLADQHKNSSGKDLRSGMLFQALNLEYDEDKSKLKVDLFLEKEEFKNYKTEKLYWEVGQEKLATRNSSNGRSRVSVIRFWVARRANSESFIGKFLSDQFIRIFRSGIDDMDRFVPIHRYASGAK